MEFSMVRNQGKENAEGKKNNQGISGRLNSNRTSNLIPSSFPKAGRPIIYTKNCFTSTSRRINVNTFKLLTLLLGMLIGFTAVTHASPYIMTNCMVNPQLSVEFSDVSSCKYGFEEDACGQFFCTKGPKSYCGGKFERYGICGEGLMCNKCNRCTGCSTKTFECWYDDNCIWSSD